MLRINSCGFFFLESTNTERDGAYNSLDIYTWCNEDKQFQLRYRFGLYNIDLMLQINSMLSFCKHDRYTGRCIYMYYFKQGNTAFYELLNKSTPCPKILFCMRGVFNQLII